jgi:hypothetical protein
MNALHSIALAVLLVAPSVPSAQEPTTVMRRQADADRAVAVARLPRGHAFTSAGEPYRIVGGVRVLRRPAHESEAQTLARAGATASDVVDRKGSQYVVVRSRDSVTATVPRTGYLAAVNGRTGNLGVLSGILEVRLRKGADPAELASAHGLTVVSSAPRLSMTFLRVPAGRDLAASAVDLARDPVVESVEIEVIEHLATPR